MTEEQKQAFASKNYHISIAEIEKNMADTQREIDDMILEAKGYELMGDKMSLLRAGARRDGAKRRAEFIEWLKEILGIRRATEISDERK